MNAETKARWAWGDAWSINTTLSSCFSSWGRSWAEGPDAKAWDRKQKGQDVSAVLPPCPCTAAVVSPHSAVRLHSTAAGWRGSCTRSSLLIDSFRASMVCLK